MALFKGRQKSKLNYLEMTPIAIHPFEQRDENTINILVPKFTNKFLVKHLMPRLKHPYIKAKLDIFGSETYKLIDGKNKVSDIADKLYEKFGEQIQPVYERLTMFLTNLYRAGFINFLEIKKGKNNE